MGRSVVLCALALLLSLGCDDRSTRPLDGGAVDSGTVDADSLSPDAAARVDAGDATVPLDAQPPAEVGTITGQCGELDSELTSPMPFLLRSAIELPAGFDLASDGARLSPGAQEIVADGNAGGSSLESEVFAYELLHRCDGAELRETETEVVYTDPAGRKTDFVVVIDGTRVGVSVTRAVSFPHSDPYLVADARDLLEGKLDGIEASSNNVSSEHAWDKQILVVVAYSPMHGESIVAAWEGLPAAARRDTVVYVMVTDGDDAFLY